MEPALFKAHFKGPFTEYIDTPENFNKRVAEKSKVAAKQRQEKVNIDALHHPEKYVFSRWWELTFCDYCESSGSGRVLSVWLSLRIQMSTKGQA